MALFTDVFDDVTKHGRKIPTTEYKQTGLYPIIDQGQSAIAGYTNETEGVFTDVPAIIFGDHTRALKYVDRPCFLGADGVKLLKAKISNPNYRYLYYALCYADIPNTGYNRHFKWLKEVEIPIPSEDEQKQIVNVLDKTSALIELRQQQLTQLDTLIKARFVEMFGDAVSNSKQWHTDNLSMVCKAIYGGGTPSKAHPEYFKGSIPWVSPKDMKSAVIFDSIDYITEEAVRDSTTKMVPIGAVLMVIRSGILKHTLPVAIAAVELTLNQDMKAFVVGDNITSEFLMYYFKAIEADVLSGVRGVTADNIDFKTFQQRQVIVPPLSLQNQFTAFVAQVDKSKAVVQEALNKAQLLFDSLMQKYFG